ncbi:MAG TPA: C4-type zinc ribbon domain-containing protein [Methylomirabilota bacterium]|nr:C4-type zinc ribbon domain-containing protein [Methylomirabilota bacterium]
MNDQLKALVELQGVDTKIGNLEALLAKIPDELSAIHASVQQVHTAVEGLRTAIENSKKEIRTKEKELEFLGAQRAKCEAKLYEVKTNKEYSAVLTEIEQFKTQQGKIEEEILTLMDRQERMSGEQHEAQGRLTVRQEEARREEAEANQRLAKFQVEVEAVRSERAQLLRGVPADLLAGYERLLRRHHGLAVVQIQVSPNATCGGCYVALTPQRFQEVRQQTQIHECESCGRFLYWLPAY